MRFSDNDIRLLINGLKFKAYLEDSDINHVTKDQALPLAPISFNNDSMATRVNQTAKFTFNVFSETREECVNNFNNLLSIIESIKPLYTIMDDQYVPNSANITGFVTLSFAGMPYKNRNAISLHLTSFNYSINKEIGYIQIGKSELAGGQPKFYEKSNMKLVPLAYKLSLEGKVLLSFDETVRRSGSRIKRSSKELYRVLIEQTGIDDIGMLDQIREFYRGATNGKEFVSLPSDKLYEAADIIINLANREGVLEKNGHYINPFKEYQDKYTKEADELSKQIGIATAEGRDTKVLEAERAEANNNLQAYDRYAQQSKNTFETEIAILRNLGTEEK